MSKIQKNPEQLSFSIFNTVRVETAITRYPAHFLEKNSRGIKTIEIRKKQSQGKIESLWQVSHNSLYGQPGQQAYRIDTIVINRIIDENQASLQFSNVIKIGSLRDICKMMEVSEGNNAKIKKALLQNASAFIRAKIKIKDKNGHEFWDEIAGTRYTVKFRGEKLPNGETADAVYIILNDWYWQLLKTVPTRPLDYDYLKVLPPTSQRLYEILSFQIFASLKHGHSFARLQYSEFCLHAPQTRHLEYDRVKKQMQKIHTHHLRSGYIKSVKFEKFINEDQQSDWWMIYEPGEKARQEYLQNITLVNGRSSKFDKSKELANGEPQNFNSAAQEKSVKSVETDLATAEFSELQNKLLQQLLDLDVSRETAIRLVKDKPDQVELQIKWLPLRNNVKGSAGYIIKAIERGYREPKAAKPATVLSRDSDDSLYQEQKPFDFDAAGLLNDLSRTFENALQQNDLPPALDKKLKSIAKKLALLSKDASADSDLPFGEVHDRLEQLQKATVEALVELAEPSVKQAHEATIAEQLKQYQNRWSARIYEETFNLNLINSLRIHYNLPKLDIFSGF